MTDRPARREVPAAVWADLDAVLDRMDSELAALRAARDDRRIFLAVYRTMTASIHRGLADGRFLDPPWTAVLTTRFAGLYLEAAASWRATGRCAAAWEAAFAVAGRPRVSAVEHALLGINAHIVYDLPIAVATTMRELGDVVDGRLHADTLVRRRHDYEVVNHLLTETIEAAQEVLAGESRLAGWLDTLALELDAYVAELLLRVSRTQGWHTALALAVARDEVEQQLVLDHLDRVACGYVRRIDVTQLVPTRAGRAVLRRIRPPFTELLGDRPG